MHGIFLKFTFCKLFQNKYVYWDVIVSLLLLPHVKFQEQT